MKYLTALTPEQRVLARSFVTVERRSIFRMDGITRVLFWLVATLAIGATALAGGII